MDQANLDKKKRTPEGLDSSACVELIGWVFFRATTAVGKNEQYGGFRWIPLGGKDVIQRTHKTCETWPYLR